MIERQSTERSRGRKDIRKSVDESKMIDRTRIMITTKTKTKHKEKGDQILRKLHNYDMEC